MFLDVNIKESENSESIVSKISSELNGNCIYLFNNREALIGKDPQAHNANSERSLLMRKIQRLPRNIG